MENLAFHSLLRWKMIILYQFSLPHLYIALYKVGRMYFWNLGVKGLNTQFVDIFQPASGEKHNDIFSHKRSGHSKLQWILSDLKNLDKVCTCSFLAWTLSFIVSLMFTSTRYSGLPWEFIQYSCIDLSHCTLLWGILLLGSKRFELIRHGRFIKTMRSFKIISKLEKYW